MSGINMPSCSWSLDSQPKIECRKGAPAVSPRLLPLPLSLSLSLLATTRTDVAFCRLLLRCAGLWRSTTTTNGVVCHPEGHPMMAKMDEDKNKFASHLFLKIQRKALLKFDQIRKTLNSKKTATIRIRMMERCKNFWLTADETAREMKHRSLLSQPSSITIKTQYRIAMAWRK
jgi:hypothetical protein